MYQPTIDPKAEFRSRWSIGDVLLPLAIISLIFIIVQTASKFTGTYDSDYVINLSLSFLPTYALQTLVRMLAAYGLSLVFTLVYAYVAYRSATWAKVLVPLLDILQSIPVLSFLPAVVLALVGLFPGQRLGIELASILLIFTGMTWNMTFSFYQSLNSIPQELIEASQVYRLSAWQRFWTLELPSGVVGLVWNSVMSVAGGWFFLMQTESFTLSDRNFTLPGLGAFLKAAADKGDNWAIFWGIIVLIGIITIIDYVIWRPMIAWAEKFKYETVEATQVPESRILDFLRRSPTMRIVSERLFVPVSEAFNRGFSSKVQSSPSANHRNSKWTNWLNWILLGAVGFLVLGGTLEAVLLLSKMPLSSWQQVILGAAFTSIRVLVVLILSLLITVPIGVTIGRSPKLAQFLQPIVQIAASVPATALFPILLLGLANFGGGLDIGAVILMTLGSMWYILFNVIAGAQAIPSELFEAARVYKLSSLERWRTLILPGIFPYLVTGIITAVGGAWNASIAGEYIKFQGKILTATGLGSTITQASDVGDFPLLLASTIVMSLLVVTTNRLVWRPLYRLAQVKYQLIV
ncbi:MULTISPECIES: ABC transporter permease [Pseudanabaena]|uniref:ABC-type transporter, integral membrane subunit n=2 Tax=Pseudanabaena TaxID=1152 RepID=L8MXF1_9CYAN|nr:MULTISPECIES: ABC transporter permease subunit [Pseudanabaena]ELS31135.1 ABC-type transporter, integral membrane subunit [Pseudanabaena biceps PCC 7429]MDG3496600.1 ABC transporter permease subunit [Pseudanabaena catenata USMAC16]